MSSKQTDTRDTLRPALDHEELVNAIEENSGRIVENHHGKAFVYHEWPETVEGGTVPSVRVMPEVRREDSRRLLPMEFNVCPHCAADLKPIGEIGLGDPELVCVTCRSFHHIP